MSWWVPTMADMTPFGHRRMPPKGLTCIHQRIHCAATPTHEGERSETERIIIDNFLHTLAEVALAVASRRARQHNDKPA